jgi:hypothetical protein
MVGRSAQRPGQNDHDQDQQRLDAFGLDSVLGVERETEPADAVDVDHHHHSRQDCVNEALPDDQLKVAVAINEIGDDGRRRERRESGDQV